MARSVGILRWQSQCRDQQTGLVDNARETASHHGISAGRNVYVGDEEHPSKSGWKGTKWPRHHN
jgi:hypothetical protein